MILHPGILALIIGSTISLMMLLFASVTGAKILLHWNLNSSSPYQLTLERRTYLVSTLVNSALVLQIATVLLFIYTVEDIHQLFVGAMCATGSLNANPIGWYVLLSKILLFFLSGFWIALNYIDQKAEEYPLIKLKYLALFGLAPIVGADLYLQLRYFLGLNPDIITSCCGSLFGNDGNTTITSLTALPIVPTMITFYTGSVVVVGSMMRNLYRHSEWLTVCGSLLTTFFFLLAIVSIITFISIYIYELPTHHCPFDILQREYNYLGYPLYGMLFTGTYFGILPGLFYPLKKIPCLTQIIHTIEIRWIYWCLGNIIGFIALVSWAIYSSNLS